MQFHKVRAGLARYGQAAHDHDMLAALDELIVLQALIDDIDQLFGASLHLDAMRPHAPPQRKLAIDVLRGRIGQDGRAWAILRDEMSRRSWPGRDDNSLHTDLFCHRT